jgi:hypothetical protein
MVPKVNKKVGCPYLFLANFFNLTKKQIVPDAVFCFGTKRERMCSLLRARMEHMCGTKHERMQVRARSVFDAPTKLL